MNTISDMDDIGVVTPTEDMASVMCDFQEMLWSGSNQFKIVLNNWGTKSLSLAKGQQVGSVEPADIVPEDDPVWEDTEVQVLLCKANHRG